MTQIAENYELTLDQVREGARLLAINTAKTDNDTLTAETVGQFKQGISWAHCQIQASRQQQCLIVNEAEARYQTAVAATAHTSAAHSRGAQLQ